MLVNEYIKKLLGDDEALSDFMQLALNSSPEIPLTSLIDVYQRNSKAKALFTYEEWISKNRQVCYGEHGTPYRDVNSKYKSGLTYLFDIKQTKGTPIKEKTSFDEESFENVFIQLNDISNTLFGESIEQHKEILKKSLNIKTEVKKNENKRSIDEQSGISYTLRPNDRADNGYGQADSGNGNKQLSFFEQGERKDRQIRVTSRRILEISEFEKIHEDEGRLLVGTSIDNDRREGGEFDGRDVSEQTDTSTIIQGSVQPDDSISNGNQRDNFQGDYTAVRNERLDNYKLTNEDFEKRTPKERCKDNILAINTIKSIRAEQRQATSEEQSILAKYVGWGGLSTVFEKNTPWQAEQQALRALLNDAEYESAEGSVLNAHFTPKVVIDSIYQGLQRMGVKQGKVLEPSCGTGNFIGCCPSDMDMQFNAVELDVMTADIAKAL